jgi:4-hydroxybenzoyl-CoA thioesterase
MANAFTTERKIRFSHCDPAGIVYFVNFFDMVGGAVEDWFSEALGGNAHAELIRRRVGFPIVNTACEFFRPCHLGDRLQLELSVAKLGRSSIEFAVTGRVAGEEKFRARHKVAMMSLDSQRAQPIPQDMRVKMQPYVHERPEEEKKR